MRAELEIRLTELSLASKQSGGRQSPSHNELGGWQEAAGRLCPRWLGLRVAWLVVFDELCIYKS